MQIFVIVCMLLLFLAIGFYTSSPIPVQSATNSGGPAPRYLWAIIAALTCIPAGFGLPLLLGMQGLGVWPVAICIWLVGAGISGVRLPQGGRIRQLSLFACWANLVLVGIFGPMFLLAAMVSR
jgi:hypothetical protein